MGMATPFAAATTVVALADEFGFSTAEMLEMCERAGVDAHDGSSPVEAESAQRLRELRQLSRPRPAAIPPPPTSKPELTSPCDESVRTRRVLAISVIVVSAAAVLGVVVDQLLR